jgi:hypothetical protein
VSFLTEHPDVMLEALVVLVRRLGGEVTITRDEAPGPFNLFSKFDGERLHLVLDETITHEQVDLLNTGAA